MKTLRAGSSRSSASEEPNRPGRLRLALGCAASLLLAATASAQITVYDDIEYRGPALTFNGDVRDLRSAGWNDRISSLRIGPGVWEICRDVDFRDCRVVRSDERDLRRSGWNDSISSLRSLGGNGAGLTAFEDFGYRGGTRTFDREIRDLRSIGWNDKISSLRVGSGLWELCREIDFRDCQTFRADEQELGRGWNDSISSLRRVDSDLPLVEVFEHFDYDGASHTFERAVSELGREGWNDRISSLRVISGRWQVCRHNGYRECREIGGSERELPRDWNDSISSLRPLRPFSND
jgi:hypothetical protein